MAVTLLVRTGGSAEQPAPSISLEAPLIVIGRGEGCDVRLPDPSVSLRHATIRQRGGERIVIDEGSTNGTYIGGVRLGAQAPRILQNGELLRVGRVWLEVRFDAPVPVDGPLATKELALALVARALDAQGEGGGPRITVTSGPDAGKILLLDEAGRAYVIGRGADVDLSLDDPNASRRHVQIVRRGDQVMARDLGSKNGAMLGAISLSVDRDRAWIMGDDLVIGDDRFGYAHPAVEALRELDQAADEKLRLDEAIDPPVLPIGSSAGRGSTPPPGSREGAYGASAAAPIAVVPDGSNSGRARSRSGWTSTDVVVVLLAMGVLGLSIVGLFWMLKG